jgi:hypothetical protein
MRAALCTSTPSPRVTFDGIVRLDVAHDPGHALHHLREVQRAAGLRHAVVGAWRICCTSVAVRISALLGTQP